VTATPIPEVVLPALPREEWDVLVIGAGLAGGLTALLAARQGARVLLVDKKGFPREKVCGGCLNLAALQVFSRAGLLDSLATLGGAWLDRYELFAGGRPLSIPLSGGVSVSRSRLDAWLVDQGQRAGVTFLDQVQATVMGDEPAASRRREVELLPSGHSARRVNAKVVVVADGLGQSSLSRQAEFDDQVERHSLVGLAARARIAVADVSPVRGTIAMAVGQGGYVGLARDETGDVHLAAAIDPRVLRQSGGPGECVRNLLRQAGHPLSVDWTRLAWLGTGPLTHHLPQAASHRMFVVGDAVQYIEPFTGEGMAWALQSAEQLVPRVIAGLDGWTPELAQGWNQMQRARRGGWCRWLTGALRRRWLVQPVVAGLRQCPAVARWLATRIDPPSELSRTWLEPGPWNRTDGPEVSDPIPVSEGTL